jgi:uncharacterized Zn-binding protein involved in type VI secretion
MPHASAWRFLPLAVVVALFSCQSTNTEPASVSEVACTVSLSTPAYMPDQIRASVGVNPVASTWDSLTPTSFRVKATLSQPLGVDTFQFLMQRWGMQFTVVKCVGLCEPGRLLFDKDPVALRLLRLMDSTPGQPRTRIGLMALYANALLSGDTSLSRFPRNAPVGISTDSVLDVLLVAAQAGTTSLMDVLGTSKWLPTRNPDSLRTLYLDLIRRQKLTSADSSRLFPGVPKLLRLPDLAVRLVAKDSGQYLARWVVSGGSAPLTVQINGDGAAVEGSIYSRGVPLELGINSVDILVTDRTGATASDTISVVRDDGPPTLRRIVPADTTAVLFDSSSLSFEWYVSDISGVRRVTIGGKVATRSGNIWTARVELVAGSNRIIAVAEDSLGTRATDTFALRRLPDRQAPKVASIEGLGARWVPFDSASIPVGWWVSDAGGVQSVRIGGVLTNGFSGRFQTSVALKPGINSVVIEAHDSAGNVRRDSVLVQRHRAMAVQVVGAGDATAALLQDGSVRVWGGALGAAIQPSDMGIVTSLAAGIGHLLALTSVGTVFGWGFDVYGESTPPDRLTGVIAIVAGGFHSLALKRDGSLVGWGDTTFGVTQTPYGLSDVAAITTGYQFSVALKKDGTVWAWGDSSKHQSPAPTLSRATAVSAGFAHALVLQSDSTVKAWGDNTNGQSTVPANLPKVIGIAAGGRHSLALLADSTVMGWGDNAAGQTTVPKSLRSVVAIAAGDGHSIALRKDGTVVVWGDNASNQADVPATLASP